ncbi:MAG: diversity-generating retroelement protein bAvd family protein [Acidobacteria bacterium]|nr:MAG: diversity-generating retroelement protein bAvd family protein [Acidobacteriota bacterium]
MKDFRNLKVWELAHQFTLNIYKITASFPRDERFGLTSQMRRCSASIGSNIAEGCGKRGNAEFQRFLQIASGSASELDYQLLLARDLDFLTSDVYKELADHLTQLRRMLTSLLQKVEAERQLAKC